MTQKHCRTSGAEIHFTLMIGALTLITLDECDTKAAWYQLGRYIEPHLNNPVPKYFRVVYCNDFLPRLPYDERNCFYKHFGVCLYYDSRYIEQVMKEEQPNRNYFGMRHLMAHILNAAWELMRSLTMGNIYGPAYAEGWLSILVRTKGLVFPRMSSSDYINSVRIGKEGFIQMSSS
ncbi:hypothetical protein ACLB2K_067030 [Fragaria x ananassa]